jgi:hypothetical protein
VYKRQLLDAPGGPRLRLAQVGDAETFFGDLPTVRSWPARYIRALTAHVGRGRDRESLSATMRSGKSTLADIQGMASGSDLSSYAKDFKDVDKTFKTLIDTPKAARDITLRLSDIKPSERAEVLFIQDRVDASPGAGLYLPAKVEFFVGGTKKSTVDLVSPKVWKTYFTDLLDEDTKGVYPPTLAKVGLYNLKTLKKYLPDLGPGAPRVSGKDVEKVLKGTLDLDNGYFLGIPSAEKMEWSDEEGKLVPAEYGNMVFVLTKSKMDTVAALLLRVLVTRPDGVIPQLSLAPGDTRTPWTSPQVPYLFETLAGPEDKLWGPKASYLSLIHI